MRAYAATLPVIAALPAIGIATMGRTERRNDRVSARMSVAVALMTAIVGTCLVSPLFGRVFGGPGREQSRAPSCEGIVFARVTPGSFVDVVKDQTSDATRFAVSVSGFRAGLRELRRPSLERELAGLQPPFRLLSAPGIGQEGPSEFLLVTQSHTVPTDGAVRTLCTALSSGGYNVAYPLSNASTLDGAKD